MSIILVVVAIVVVAIAVVLALAARRPASFEVRRSLRIEAAPDAVYPHIADFHRWSAWSPFEKLDPAMQRTFGGAPSGKGARYAWEGNREAGQGSMEMVEVTPPNRV